MTYCVRFLGDRKTRDIDWSLIFISNNRIIRLLFDFDEKTQAELTENGYKFI